MPKAQKPNESTTTPDFNASKYSGDSKENVKGFVDDQLMGRPQVAPSKNGKILKSKKTSTKGSTADGGSQKMNRVTSPTLTRKHLKPVFLKITKGRSPRRRNLLCSCVQPQPFIKEEYDGKVSCFIKGAAAGKIVIPCAIQQLPEVSQRLKKNSMNEKNPANE